MKGLGPKLTKAVVAFYESGDEALLTPVFSALQPYLNRFTYATLGVGCPARRDDLVQETLVHMLEQLRERRFGAQLKEGGAYNSFLPWACMMHRNLFINSTRAKRIPGKPNAAEDAVSILPAAYVSQPDEAALLGASFDAKKLLDIVSAAVERLPQKQRQCFRLFYYENLSYEEMAEQTGINKITCRVQVCAALKSMKQWAAKSAVRPCGEVYDALIATDTGEMFGTGTRKYAPRGFFTNKSQQLARTRAMKAVF